MNKDELARLNEEKQQLGKLASLLREEKALLQAVMENSGVMLAYLDPDFNFVEVNTAYAVGSGYPVKRLIGENHFALFPDRENQSIFEKVRDMGEAAAFHDRAFEFPGRPERGVTYWDWTLSPVKNASGAIQGLVLSLVETTRRKLAEDALSHREKYFRALTESISDVVMVLNADGTIRYLSASTERVTGYPQQELAGKSIFDFVHPKDLPSLQEAFAYGTQVPGHAAAMEARIRHKDGSWRYVEGTGQNLLHDTVVAGIVASFRDITERKEVEARLALSQRLAMLGEVAGNISHELRNPLAVIDSSAFYLMSVLRDSPDDKLQAHLKRIKTSVDRSSAIMQSLLDMAGTKQPRREKFDLRAAVSEAIEVCAVSAPVQVIREFPAREAWVSGDRGQLLLAFRNLVANAVDAMQSGGTLTVKIRAGRDSVEASFADTGEGIACEETKLVFEPLFSTKASGIGLGLSLARSVVCRHGGAISVESEKGRGAVFTVRLPAVSKAAGR